MVQALSTESVAEEERHSRMHFVCHATLDQISSVDSAVVEELGRGQNRAGKIDESNAIGARDFDRRRFACR